jgi:putative NADPH-quinone reductase
VKIVSCVSQACCGRDVASDHLVLIFPLWRGTMPALVKAFLGQMMRPGVAFSYERYGAKKLLAGGSATL